MITLKYTISKIGQDAADLPWELWELTVLDVIGTRVEEHELEKLPAIIEQELGKDEHREKIRQLRDESIVNFGCAAKDTANELLHIRDELKNTPRA